MCRRRILRRRFRPAALTLVPARGYNGGDGPGSGVAPRRSNGGSPRSCSGPSCSSRRSCCSSAGCSRAYFALRAQTSVWPPAGRGARDYSSPRSPPRCSSLSSLTFHLGARGCDGARLGRAPRLDGGSPSRSVSTFLGLQIWDYSRARFRRLEPRVRHDVLRDDRVPRPPRGRRTRPDGRASSAAPPRARTARAVSTARTRSAYYWHFVDVVWIALFTTCTCSVVIAPMTATGGFVSAEGAARLPARPGRCGSACSSRCSARSRGRSAPAPSRALTDEEALGRALYEANCSTCHGIDARRHGERAEPAGGRRRRRSTSCSRAGGCRSRNPADQPERQDAEVLAGRDLRDRRVPAHDRPWGPRDPDRRVRGRRPRAGAQLFLDNCAACHGAGASGDSVGGGQIAPRSTRPTPTQIGEAIRGRARA